MNKNSQNFIFFAIFFIFTVVPVATLYFADLDQQEKDNAVLQKISIGKLAQKLPEQKELEKTYLMGKFDPATRADFTLVPTGDTVYNNVIYLRKEALGAFINMKNSAYKDGIYLKVASATRNFDYQKNIWENKWAALTPIRGKNISTSIKDGLLRFQKILEYSAAPGTSRHHWGTDIDINDATPEYFEKNNGAGVYGWLVKNAPSFGFCQPYTAMGPLRPTGYNEEKWHWSYVPLSKTFTADYKNLITENDIKGFLGDEFVPEQDLINDYVEGVNPDCL